MPDQSCLHVQGTYVHNLLLCVGGHNNHKLGKLSHPASMLLAIPIAASSRKHDSKRTEYNVSHMYCDK